MNEVQSLPRIWQNATVGDIAQIVYGRALPAKTRMEDGDIPVYASSGLVGKHNEALYDGPSIIIGRKGNVGSILYVSGPFWCIDTAFYLTDINPSVDLEYLAFLLDSANLARLSIVVGVPGISRRDIEDLEFPIPPLAEQRHIVAIFRQADELRRLRKEAEGKMRILLSAQFIQLFGDPVTNPYEWEKAPLSSLGELDRGRSRHRPRDASHLYGGPYPFVQTGDIAKANGVVTQYTQTYSEAGLAQSRLWPEGTLCITIAANIAKTAILSFDACFPDSVVGFIPWNGVDVNYIGQWFVFMQNSLEDLAPQAAQKNINLQILQDLSVPLPPLDLQQKFAHIVSIIREKNGQIDQMNMRIQILIQALQAKAFTGELTAAWREQHQDELVPVVVEQAEQQAEPQPVDAWQALQGRRKTLLAGLSTEQARLLRELLKIKGYFTLETAQRHSSFSPLVTRQGLQLFVALGLLQAVRVPLQPREDVRMYVLVYRTLTEDDQVRERDLSRFEEELRVHEEVKL